MPIRIIKGGSSQAALARRIAFGETMEPGEPEQPAAPEWMVRAASCSSKGSDKPANMPKETEPAPQVDLAQIEKAAYESGFRQGEKAGMAIAEKKVEASMRRYAEALLELGKLRARTYRDVESEVVRLALEVARKIVHREIHADHQIIQTLIKVALSNVAEKSAVTIHLNPTDYNFVLEHRGELAPEGDGGREIALLADKSIERGGCLIQTECGDIDARIEEEFHELERGFFEGTGRDDP